MRGLSISICIAIIHWFIYEHPNLFAVVMLVVMFLEVITAGYVVRAIVQGHWSL